MSLSTLSFTFLTLQSVCDFSKTSNTMRSFFVRKHRKIASEFFCCQHNNSRPKFNAQFNKINQTEEKEKLLLNASLFLVRYVYTISLFPKQMIANILQNLYISYQRILLLSVCRTNMYCGRSNLN